MTEHSSASAFFIIGKIILISKLAFAVTNSTIVMRTTVDKPRVQEQRYSIDKRKALAAIHEQSLKTKEIQEKLNLAKENQEILNHEIEATTKEIVRNEQEAQLLKKAIISRMIKVQQQEKDFIANIIFTSLSAEEIERSIKINQKISKMDQILLLKFLELLKEKKQLLTLKNVKQSQLKEVVSHLSNQQEELNKARAHKRKIIAQLNKNIKNIKAQIAKMPEFQFLFEGQKGLMPPPLIGKLEEDFGVKKIDKGVYYRNKGIFISADLDAPVTSIADGEVSYAEETKLLGNTLIVDHGDNYFTVYSRISNPQVKLGHKVKKNQLLGRVSFSPLYKRSGLYFEIRYFSESLNPHHWLKGLTR